MKGGLQRRLATGVNAILVAVFVIVGVALSVDLAGRVRWRVDLSSGGSATLDQDTLAALAEADEAGEGLEVIGTSHQRRQADSLQRDQRVRDLLRELDLESTTVRTTWIDLDRDRQSAERLEIDRYGTLVVRSAETRVDFRTREVFKTKGRVLNQDQSNLDFRGEALVARGIRQVLSGRPRKIVVLSGHGELSLDDAGSTGLQQWVSTVEKQGWDVDSLDLLRDRDVAGDPRIPEGTDAVVVAAPKTGMDPSEETAIRTFVRGGGGVLVYLEPGRPVPAFLEALGVRVPTGVAFDRPSIVPYDDRWVPRFGRHPIVDDLAEEDLKVVFSHGAALEVDDVLGVTQDVLLRSSNAGWLEVEPERPPADLDIGVDEAGPVVVGYAIAVEPGSAIADEAARVAVFGDASMIGNELMAMLGNPGLSVNAMRWVVGDDDRMSVVGRTSEVRQVELSPEALARLGWFVIGGWPLIVVLLGGVVWWLRREQ